MAIGGGDGSIVLTTKVDESGLKSGLSKLKSGVGAFGKAFAVAGAAGIAAFASITKAAVDSYAEYEQLAGGVETLFKDSAGQLMKYADQAYKTAGLSANEYMSTITSFSASLLQSLGGDTAKAAEYANQAVIDMADNANKMGTSMEMIQNAYQGFAKQNYTMLDNLKLGYGGTKEEMQRLLDNAEKISGIKYDISSFADVTEAIHVIQVEMGISGYSAEQLQEKISSMSLSTEELEKVAQDMGITYEEAMARMNAGTLTTKDAQVLLGTTAKEASSTIQGSFASMKGAWQNLLTGMADPTQDFNVLLQNFISSVGTFAGNLLPVIQTAAQGVLQMVQGLLPQLATMVSQMLPMVVEGAVGIVNGIVQVAPQIVEAIVGLLPQLLTATTNLITQIATALPALMQIIVLALPTIIQSIVVALPAMIPALINGIVQAIIILVAAFPQIIQPIIDNLPMIITSITGALLDNLPILIKACIQLVVAIVAALPQIIASLLDAIGGIAIQIGETLFETLPKPIQNAFESAFELVKAIWDKVQPYFAIIWEGIKAVFSVVGAVLGGFFETAWAAIKAVWDVVTGYFSAIWDTIAGIFSVVASVLSGNWSDAWDAIKGIVDTWTGYFQKIWDSIKNVFSAVVSWFTNVFSTAWQGIQNVWGAVVNFFSGIWSGIVGVFSGVSSWFSSIFSSAVSGIRGAFSGVVSFFSGIWSQIKGVFSGVGSWFTSVGSNIINGIISGVTGAAGSLYSSLRNLASNALSAAKSALGIHSPSRLFRDEVGKMIPKGMAIGIDKAKNLVTEATKALVTDTRTEVQKVLDDMNEEMLESEKKYAEESIRIKKEKEEKEYNEKLKNAKKELEKEKEKARKQLAEKKKTAKESSDVAKANSEYEEKIAEANAKYEEEIQKIHNDKVKKEQEQADKEFLDNLKDTAEKERKIYEARQKDIKNAQNNIVDTYENAANNILDSIKDLQQKQEALANKFKDFGSVMEDVIEIEDKFNDVHSPLTEKDGRYKLSSLQTQTKQLEKYSDLMLGLRDREGMSLELFDTIKNMSFDESFAYAEKLMRMGDKQFSNYIENWQKKQETSKRITEELFGDDSEYLGPRRILSDLQQQTNVLSDYYSLLNQVKNRAEVPEEFFASLRDMGVEEGLEYANALLELSDEDFANYIKAWEEKQKTSQLISKELYKEEAEQLATEIGDKFDEVEREFFGVGENAADQFESGFLEQLKIVVSNIKGTISSAFSNVGLGITPDYGVGGYSINVPALARGSVLPGGKPFLAIVNDQPRGQTNVEAPLDTIVEAMNIALQNNSNPSGGNTEIVLEIDGRELGRVNADLAKRESRIRGTRLVLV